MSAFAEEIRKYLQDGGFCHEGMDEVELATTLTMDIQNFPGMPPSTFEPLLTVIERADREGNLLLQQEIRRFIWFLLDGYPTRDG